MLPKIMESTDKNRMENFWPKDCHPTLLICFDRPEKGAETLAAIWRIPADLYLFRDGGGDPQAAQLFKQLFEETATLRKIYGWETYIRMEPTNLGGCHGPATAIRWFFEANPKGIVLEEDIAPHPTMIPIYSRALDAFENDQTVFALGAAPNRNVATNQHDTWTRSPLFLVWGWASWADRILPSQIPNPKHNEGARNLSRLQTLTGRLYMSRELSQLAKNPEGCWSYHLQTKALADERDVLIPQTKLTQNVGIGAHARRTKHDYDDPPNSQACLEMLGKHVKEGPAPNSAEWVRWQKSIELAKFRGITHEIRNRLRIRSRLKNLFSEKP